MWGTETRLWKAGIGRLAGVDEVGRGPLAGPVVAAAVVLPGPADKGHRRAKKALLEIRDSKQLSEAARERYYALIGEHAVAWAVGIQEVADIDRVNILQASLLAMREALGLLEAGGSPVYPDHVLVDGNVKIPGLTVPQDAIVDGDAHTASIAAASIMAKVHRDRLMCELHDQFPAYGFDRNKGYGTAFHLAALTQHGPCAIHRRSFKPVRDALGGVLSGFVPPD